MRRPGAANSVAWKHQNREIQLGSSNLMSSALRLNMYRDFSNIVAIKTRGGLVQNIQLPGNITNERLSWVPVTDYRENKLLCSKMFLTRKFLLSLPQNFHQSVTHQEYKDEICLVTYHTLSQWHL
ncbi:hypothetical protein T265_01024 [Opisthorchis viverrini]|uniref:Uncharacterized protein n=1 Tax=Opisthorchis viverrini TaxID=6198 RepID=A0A074ZZN7_OPIVI|nr:hypothetical protein T265_01024 [Opisthorchis viverrini]KER32928.1 hypothetical protein T265_01024 [Opisthorchis viverrini]